MLAETSPKCEGFYGVCLHRNKYKLAFIENKISLNFICSRSHSSVSAGAFTIWTSIYLVCDVHTTPCCSDTATQVGSDENYWATQTRIAPLEQLQPELAPCQVSSGRQKKRFLYSEAGFPDCKILLKKFSGHLKKQSQMPLAPWCSVSDASRLLPWGKKIKPGTSSLPIFY